MATSKSTPSPAPTAGSKNQPGGAPPSGPLRFAESDLAYMLERAAMVFSAIEAQWKTASQGEGRDRLAAIDAIATLAQVGGVICDYATNGAIRGDAAEWLELPRPGAGGEL